MNPVVWVPIAVAVVAAFPAYLAYRRSRTVDQISAASGIAADGRAGVAQVISALESLNDQLQEDNAVFREQLKHQAERFERCWQEREELKRELARLRRKYGDNGDTPPWGTPKTHP